jgi:N-methylhydantoinase A
MLVGVDIGGTFTDVVVLDTDQGRAYTAKVLTTPSCPDDAVLSGIAEVLGEVGGRPGEVRRLVHATTLATNLVLERRGARVAHVTTRGFGPLVQLQQLGRGLVISFDDDEQDADVSPPLVPPDLIEEVSGRLDWTGREVEPLDEVDVVRVVASLAAKAPESVAVCLMHSYANPDHEQRVAEQLRRGLPGSYVVASADVWPESGEGERASTTIVSAYVGPMMARYLGELGRRLVELGMTCPVHVMQSAGSVMPADEAARRAVHSIESGPAAGVIRAVEVSRRTGRPNLLSFDMGGTTAKVGLVRGHRPSLTGSFRVGGGLSAAGQRVGEVVRIPVIDLAEVGAGGGSIASVDDGGFLQVGPRSAGAWPGPACYGLGGELATVTDADVVLGYLSPDSLLGGKLQLHPERSRRAIAEHVAMPLGVDVVTAARGIFRLVNVLMGSAVRALTVRRGIDPRDFALTAFGGAGPVHAANVAEQFAIPTIVVPPSPGVASAFGLLTTDVAYDYVTAADAGTSTGPAASTSPAGSAGQAGSMGQAERIGRIFETMEARGRAELERSGIADGAVRIERATKMHFLHQAGQLPVPVPAGPVTEQTVAEIDRRFRDLYFDLYRVRPDDPSTFVSFSVRAVGAVPRPEPSVAPRGGGDAGRALKASRDVHFEASDGPLTTAVYERARLAPGDALGGPCLVEEPDSTTVCPPGYEVTVDDTLNLVMTPR